MAKDVIMPALGMAQESGVLVKWLVPEGASVIEGEPLMEVETDKAIVEVPANATGTLANVTYHEGAELAIGTVLAVILEPGEDAGAVARGAVLAGSPGEAVSSAPVPPTAPTAALILEAAPAPIGAALAAGRSLASPKAKRLARDYGLALASVTGTGPGGAVRAVDLVPPAALAVDALAKVQAPARASAAAPMSAAAPFSAPPARTGWCQATIDAAPLLRFLENVNSSSRRAKLGFPWPQRVAPADFLARALAGALRRADTQGLAERMADSIGVRVYTAVGAARTVVLTSAQFRTVFDAAVAREAAEGAAADERVYFPPVLVEDRSAQPFEQSGVQLVGHGLVRLTLGPILAAGPLAVAPAEPRRDATLRLDYDASGLDDPGAAAVFSHLTWVLEDPFSLAVYG